MCSHRVISDLHTRISGCYHAMDNNNPASTGITRTKLFVAMLCDSNILSMGEFTRCTFNLCSSRELEH